jgi:hypothetical protein
MPAKSKKQLRLIWAIRGKYKTKTKTPKKWKWVWGEEWTHLQKESFILKFGDFINESILTEEDREMVEDLVIDLADKYFLSFEGGKGNKGYVSVQFFKIHPDAIQFGIQLNEEFDNENKPQFEEDLELILKKIEHFGYETRRFAWNSVLWNTTTYSFEVRKN